jgi:hypothetical protein
MYGFYIDLQVEILANFAFAPTFKWWHNIVLMDFRFP